MAIGAFVPIMLWAPKNNFVKGLLIGALVVVLFGLADDIKDLRPKVKLLGQTAAALIVTLFGGIKINDLKPFWLEGSLLPDWGSVPLTVFVIVGITNATNLSDGLDGLAGGIALLIFLCIGYFGVIGKDWVLVMIAVALGGSVLGFLRFNSYPAQLFMGDAGSQLLGFVAIVLAIKIAQQSPGSAILPLIIFGIPILDTATVMFKRLSEGRSPFSADRNHFHHRLMKVGLFHTEAVMTIYLAQALLIIFAICCHGSNGWILLLVYLLFACGVLVTFHIFDKTDFQIERGQFLISAKARLKKFKDGGQIIKISFGFVKIGLPVLIIFNVLFQFRSSSTDLMLSGSVFLFILMAWFLNKEMLNRIAKVAFYLFTPFIIYKCDIALHETLGPVLLILYNALYMQLLASVLLTMNLTRRSNGFKNSTLDFLVIFVILSIPNLPVVSFNSYLLELVAVKTVIMYYSYEVLIGETRKTSFKWLKR